MSTKPTRKKRLTFVADVRDCWKWLSMWAMALAGAIQATWVSMPDDMKATIPPNLVFFLTMALMVFGMLGRTVNQK